MIPFSIQPEIREIFPDIHVGLMTGMVKNSQRNEDLWLEINTVTKELQSHLNPDLIREMQFIKMGKSAYRLLGKDPSRYRISAEALLRRIAKGNGIYQINSLVDILNFVSISTGITIGGFDKMSVKGGIVLGIGNEDEEFEAIGRGELNIHRLPVYRDELGAIGSPTSDCVRTMMKLETNEFLMIVTGFFGPDGIDDCFRQLKSLMEKHICGRNFDVFIEK